MLTGIIKSMPTYAQHHRAGVCWPREGREFIVADGKALEMAGVEARALYEQRMEQDPATAVNPDMPVVYHVATPTAQNPKLAVMKRGRIVDIPGKPVVMDELAYEYLKEVFGTYLHCEPIGGGDTMSLQQKIVSLEHEIARLNAELAEYKNARTAVAGGKR